MAPMDQSRPLSGPAEGTILVISQDNVHEFDFNFLGGFYDGIYFSLHVNDCWYFSLSDFDGKAR
jgi:hypothetical protein